MKTALGYVRVSTDEQATEGISLEAQEEKIRAYCTLKGLHLVEIIVDAGVSGGKPLASREGGSRILSAKVDAVVAVKLDRLFRDAADCLAVTKEWDRKGVALHLLDMGGNSLDTSSAMGRMFLTMAAGFAEMERGLIRERTRTALQHKRKNGKLAGKVPFGFTLAVDGDTLLENPSEREALALIRQLRTEGKTFRGIARELEARGIRTKQGRNKWQACSVRSVLMYSQRYEAAG
ncbi:MAG: recombinase family protein [Planctomycetota bacterium]|nr:recombinase family protein [Planctomycetota bacterium]